jgi:hypothetical protein
VGEAFASSTRPAHTTVDDGDQFQQILAWMMKSRWQKQNQLLHEVTGSFRSEK